MRDDATRHHLTRRSFLLRTGILGAVAAVSPSLLLAPRKGAALHDGVAAWDVELLMQALNALTVDTMKGLAAFIVPGSDVYSEAQQTHSATPGAIAAGVDRFIARNIDAAVPLPQPRLLAVLDALGREFESTPMTVAEDLDAGVGPAARWALEHLDHTVDDYLTDHPVRVSTLFALLLNLVATRVDPLAMNGLLLSPFSRLTWNEKGRVFADLEAPDPVLVDTLQRYLDESSRQAVVAALPLLANGALNLGAFGTYSEWQKFDAATRTLTQRPLGWDLCNYQPDAPPVAEGWDEFRGYYQNRRKAA